MDELEELESILTEISKDLFKKIKKKILIELLAIHEHPRK